MVCHYHQILETGKPKVLMDEMHKTKANSVNQYGYNDLCRYCFVYLDWYVPQVELLIYTCIYVGTRTYSLIYYHNEV